MRLLILSFMLLPMLCQAQYGYITGKVSDRFGPLSNVSIHIKNSPFATYTDNNGYFAFEIDTGYYEMIIGLTGYHRVETTIRLENLEQREVDLEMESTLLDADVNIGSKSTVSQNQLESPVPIDVIYGRDLVNSGQVELAQALHQILPSFYSVKQSADDGINVVDPISLRGLGPDQVLVLVNGKRRHKSAFLNVKDVFGKGTASTDLNSIPLLAIDRIEILRDGASSQYGSDALGGVINIVLKNHSFDPVVSSYAGVSGEGDGRIESLEFNYGFNVKRRGYVNMTTSYTNQNKVDRAGKYTGPIYGFDQFDTNPVVRDTFFTAIGRQNQVIAELGSSENKNASFIMNGAFELTENIDAYAFGGLNLRTGIVHGVYRFPYQEDQVAFIWHENGFAPKLVNEVADRSLTMGIRGNVRDWFIDVTYSTAQNSFDVSVENSNNASLGLISPLTSFAGGYNYRHNFFNFEGARIYEFEHGELDVAFGGEYRVEGYTLREGDTESYVQGADTTSLGGLKAFGMQGYIGVSAADALDRVRSNASGYLELDYSINNFLLSGAIRAEEYSDFGSRNNYKIAARYKFANPFLLRASYSTGFKAPTLHQIFYQRISNQFIDNQYQNVSLVNTETPLIGNILALGVGLKPETSKSISLGVTSSINRNISLSVDAYQTDITDRIGLVPRTNVMNDEFLSQITSGTNIQFIEFFANLAKTRTRGIDAVLAAQYYGADIALNLNSSFSYMETKVLSLHEEADASEGREEIGRIESYVPQSQWRNSLSTTFRKFTLTLNHTRYGSTEYLYPSDNDASNWVVNTLTGETESRDQRFFAKNIFSADLKFRIFPNLTLTVGGLNLSNQFPDKLTHSANIRNGTYTYSPNVRPFDLRGRYYYTRLSWVL